MTDIQKARDVLAKWRKEATEGQWQLDMNVATFYSKKSEAFEGYVGDTDHPHDARLIVGTAGNPDLLDAIDGLLVLAAMSPASEDLKAAARAIAAAIIAADERMSA